MAKKLLFVCILVVAIFVRFYKLGSLPNGLTWDEAAIGYNAYGLITNHRDEWLKRTPIVFQSFGDFKSPLLIYLDVFPQLLFGLTPFAVRLPVALAGVGLVVVSYFLALEIFHNKKVALSVMMFVTISPWAIHYSRMAFESMLAVFLVTTAVYFFLLWKRKSTVRVFALSSTLFALSLYAYHSAKVVVPLLVIILLFLSWKQIKQEWRTVGIGLLVALFVLLPLGYASFFGKANARAASTTIFSKPQVISTFLSNYGEHLSQAFLLSGKDITYRHSTMQVGILYPIELIGFCASLFCIITDKKYRKFWWIPTFFFIGLIPPSLGIDIPHSNRALLGLPWIQLAIGVVLLVIEEKLHNVQLLRILTVGVAIVLSAGISKYQQAYLSTYTSSHVLRELGYGYGELLQYIRPVEGQYDHVYFTNSYGQAYIYILFYKRLTPMEYQHGGLANYTISDHPDQDAKGKTHVLIVGTEHQVPTTAKVIKEVKYPDGKIAFRIAEQ